MKTGVLTAMTLLVMSSPTVAITIDFDTDAAFNSLAAGTIVTEQYAAMGVHISANNLVSGHPDLAIVFDSANPTGDDGDLATPGYHATNTIPYGKLLIIAENATDSNGDGLVDDPDDEGGQPAGWLNLALDFEQNQASFVFIDIEESGGTVDFRNNGSVVATIGIPAMGDNSRVTAAYAGLTFDEVRVNFAGSAALAEIVLVPEPGSLALLCIGGLALMRRRIAA